MNVKLLRKIQKHILAEPKRYNQDDTISTGKPGTPYCPTLKWMYPACGTVACIGGWASILASDGKRHDLYFAQDVLGLRDEEPGRLFSMIEGGGWPTRFVLAYKRARTPAGRARVAVRRIDHFIKTKGAE